MNKLIVISGCSSGGKSTLLEELKNNGYAVIPEVGREIVKEQLLSLGNCLQSATFLLVFGMLTSFLYNKLNIYNFLQTN